MEEDFLHIFLAVDQLYVAGPFKSPNEATQALLSKYLVDKENSFCEFSFEGQRFLVHLDDVQMIGDELYPLLDNPKETLGYD
jgi:hypothetical protein